GAGALGAAGWVAGLGGGWLLRPKWGHAARAIKMGIATDITGPIAFQGNANWQVAQLAVQQINDAGGVLGQPIELYLEDTASDPGIAVGNVRKLIQQHKVDVVCGGITSAMREAIKNPIVRRGNTLYIYPQLYEGQECTEHLYCTGPTPAQQCDELIPWLIGLGNKRFAFPSANYIWPQLLNKYARRVIEENGGEVIFEEYYPLDQLEYSATVARIMNENVDCVFNTVIPPGVQAFLKQLSEAGFHEKGGRLSCVYYDENALNITPAREIEGLASCLDYFQAIDDPYSAELQQAYDKMFPGSNYRFTAGSASTGMYRGIRLYEQAIIATGGDLAREAASAALDQASIEQGPGGPAKVVPGTGHVAMNMYIAEAKNGVYEVVSKYDMVDPKECET
ncbi:MAG TPA: substrate-binding protein, partial [Geminicoccaceae bacterium]|nr:substrate-binding protein [Geminicoccaceae bacterium]